MRLGKFGKILHYDKTSLGVGNIKRFIIFEFKYLGGIIINVFNTVNQDRFHSHAFHAISFMIKGYYNEEVLIDNNITQHKITRGIRFIPKNFIHKIKDSSKNAISITVEGKWDKTWSEYFDDKRVKTYTWGRKVLFDSKYFKSENDKNDEI